MFILKSRIQEKKIKIMKENTLKMVNLVIDDLKLCKFKKLFS